MSGEVSGLRSPRSGLELWLDDHCGPTSETSHPAFVRLAPAAFYCKGDEFAPFGNDAGSDMLGSLQDWYLEGMTDEELPFAVVKSLGGWDTEGITDGLWSGDSDIIDAWFATWGGSDAAHHVYHETNMLIAAAVGQFKIRGVLSPSMRRVGFYAVAVKRGELDDAKVRHPRWEQAGRARAGLEAIRRLLVAAPVVEHHVDAPTPG